MPLQRDSGDSAVYNRPLGGGEAIDEDVEGHSMLQHASPKLHATGDDDTEGHSMKLAANAGPKVRARARVSDEGEDTEGHQRVR